MNPPVITVLMSVYNGHRHLAESVSSILAQSFPDFELLIINDGSTDGSLEYLRSLADPRVVLIDQQPNRGLLATANRGLRIARGRYVAIMDQDDIAAPERLGRQFARLEAAPEIALCGTAIETFGDRPLPSWVRYQEPADLRTALLFENPFCHPTVMMRHRALASVGLAYPEAYPHAEEYALWLNLAEKYPLANLPDTLLRYRVHATQLSRTRNREQSHSIDRLVGRQLDQLGLPSGTRDLRVHHALGNGFFPLPGLARTLQAWIDRLVQANAARQVYDPSVFARQLAQRGAAALARHRAQLGAMPPFRRLLWQAATWLDWIRHSDPR